MLNAHAAAKNNLAATAMICLLLCWLTPLQRQIFSLQQLSKVCPQKFQTFFLLLLFYCYCYLANPTIAPNFHVAVKDHWFFLVGLLTAMRRNLVEWLASTFSCCFFLAAAKVKLVVVASLYLFLALLGSLFSL